MDVKGLGLKQQILLAAFECSEGDLKTTFTAEDLLVHAWGRDKLAWGLRGFEDKHPDSNKILKELDAHAGKRGIVGQGLLEKVHRRVYRLTPAGIAAVSEASALGYHRSGESWSGVGRSGQKKLRHRVFKDWLIDPFRPKHFREAGHFWGIAPGTPPKTVSERVSYIERTLKAASKALSKEG